MKAFSFLLLVLASAAAVSSEPEFPPNIEVILDTRVFSCEEPDAALASNIKTLPYSMGTPGVERDPCLDEGANEDAGRRRLVMGGELIVYDSQWDETTRIVWSEAPSYVIETRCSPDRTSCLEGHRYSPGQTGIKWRGRGPQPSERRRPPL